MIRARKVEFAEDQFYKAIGDTDLELSRAFLDAGMSAKNPFPFGNKETPLTAAVSGTACSPAKRPTAGPTLDLVQLLIARGADASIADEHGNTPLMQAAMGGCDAVVMGALLKAGGRVNANESGRPDRVRVRPVRRARRARSAPGRRIPAASRQGQDVPGGL